MGSKMNLLRLHQRISDKDGPDLSFLQVSTKINFGV